MLFEYKSNKSWRDMWHLIMILVKSDQWWIMRVNMLELEVCIGCKGQIQVSVLDHNNNLSAHLYILYYIIMRTYLTFFFLSIEAFFSFRKFYLSHTLISLIHFFLISSSLFLYIIHLQNLVHNITNLNYLALDMFLSKLLNDKNIMTPFFHTINNNFTFFFITITGKGQCW